MENTICKGGLGKTLIPMVTIGLGLVAKVILDMVLTPMIGINGAAWATNATFAVAALINLWFVGRLVGSIISALAMGGASEVVFLFLQSLVGNNIAVALTIIVALLVYVVTLWITKALVYKDLYNFPVIGKKLRARDGK